MKWNVLTQGLTKGAIYDASAQDYYDNLQRQYEIAKRQEMERKKQNRELEKQRLIAEQKKAKFEQERKTHLEKLKNDTSAEEREKAAVRAQEKWGKGETPDQRDIDLFEISDYKKSLPTGGDDTEWYERAWRSVKDFFLSADGIAATGQKMNEIQASQFGGNIVKSREDQQLLDMAEDYYRGNRTVDNLRAIQELNRRKPGILNKTAVYLNKALDWIGNNPVTGTTGAFLGTDELDKVRINIDFDEDTNSEQALQNIEALRNSYKAFDEESYNAYLENHNKAKYYENMLSDDYKRKVDIAEGRLPDENGVVDGSVEFFNFGKLSKQLPGIIAGSISSPSQLVGSIGTGIVTAAGVAATAAAAGAAVVGTGGLAAPAVIGGLTALGAATTFGLNQASGSHENAAEVDEGYISKVRYGLEQHPGIAADFYKRGRSVLGKSATEEDIIIAKLANKIPAQNKIVESVFNDAAIGSQRQYDRDMVATTGDSAIDTALEITPFKFFTTLGKQAIKANLRSSRIARAANKIGDKLNKLNAGDDGVLRKAFTKYGAIASPVAGAIGGVGGAIFDNVLSRIPKVNTAIKAMAHFDIPKIKKFGPKSSNWINYVESIAGRGFKSSLSEGIEEGKQYYNQQLAVQEFQEGLKNGNLSYETQTILGDLFDDFLAGNFAASGLVNAITGIPMLDYLHYTDTNIINTAEAIKNIKSGMIGGHAQTSFMTAISGYAQTKGTSNAIDDLELAIRALEENKLTAQKQFSQDQVLSRTDGKYIASAIEYLKSSNKFSDEDLEALQNRAAEVSGVSNSKYMKKLAKELDIPDEDYHKFVADYMYHRDNLQTERDNLQSAVKDLNAKANKIKAESENIENPSETIANQWAKDDTDANRSIFESDKAEQIKKLQDRLQVLNDRLEKEALTNSQKAEINAQIGLIESQIQKKEESEFDESKTLTYADTRFGRINALARIGGAIKQLEFLDSILSAMGDSNVAGKKFVQGQIDATKKLLNGWLVGNKLADKQLTSDDLAEVKEWLEIVARNIERADKDNMSIVAASENLTNQINSLAQAYQEHSNAVLNYNIASALFKDFIGYDTVYDAEKKTAVVVPEGTEGAKHVKGNAKKHLQGIISAQDDDAKLEQAYRQGFSDYGFAGVYKNESPLVQDQEEEEELEKPGTIARRLRIRELSEKIGKFMQDAKKYVSGKWVHFGNKEVFIPDGADERDSLDPAENQMDKLEFYNLILQAYKYADDADKWLDKSYEGHHQMSNANIMVVSYFDTFLSKSDELSLKFFDEDGRDTSVFYNGIQIGTITPIVTSNKANGDPENGITYKVLGFDFSKIDDDEYLSSLISSLIQPYEEEVLVENGDDNPRVSTPKDITEEQDAKIQALTDLEKKMNARFDSTLRTASHYFEWIDTGGGRKLKLWHRLHDEIGSNFRVGQTNRSNWSMIIKQLYAKVYHSGYDKGTPDGVKDIPALLNYLHNYYENEHVTEEMLDRIEGYVIYLNQEGNDITDTDLYECIKGIAEEIAGEVGSDTKNLILDRGTAIDTLCRVVFGTEFDTPKDAIEHCKTLEMTAQSGNKESVTKYFTKDAFDDVVTHLWNTRKVYVEDLGYTLWTAPFTIYTNDFKNDDGTTINIAGEIDMLAIDREGNAIIIDYKTSADPFFLNGKLSPFFTSTGKRRIRSAEEQYINQQSAYIQMLNETTRKETSFAGGFDCGEARIFPVHLISKDDLIKKAEIEFSKDQQLVLQTIPFDEMGNKEGLVFSKEDFRKKLSRLSKMYAKVQYLTDRLTMYYDFIKDPSTLEILNERKKTLDSMFLSLQEITDADLTQYDSSLNEALEKMEAFYFGNKDTIENICKRYDIGELRLSVTKNPRSFNNINWDNPINDNDVDKLGGFSAMGVKDRAEYDQKVDELAHVSCNKDFQRSSTAKLTAVEYKTRRGNDKIAVYASITYNGTTYPPIRLYLAEKTGEQFAKDVLAGNTVGSNIRTTVGLLSRCSDGHQHSIGENKQLVQAIRGTEDNPYENFMADMEGNDSVAVVLYNKSTGVLSTISGDSDAVIELPRSLRKGDSANGHIVINVRPENSESGAEIPIICNTPKIIATLGVDKANHRTQSLLDFLTEVVFRQINDIPGGNPLKERMKNKGEEIPLTYEQFLGFFFEKASRDNKLNKQLIGRPQYELIPPPAGEKSRLIRIGDFSKDPNNGGAKIIRLDDIDALKKAICQLSIWISTDMAGVKWNSGRKGCKKFNEFAEFLSKLEPGEKFYFGGTGIYLDKSDADGTYLGFLAKNGLLTTPFNGFSHPLISINTCQKEDTTPYQLLEPGDTGAEGNPLEGQLGEGGNDHKGGGAEEGSNEGLSAEDILLGNMAEYVGLSNDDEEDSEYKAVISGVTKLQKGSSRLDQTAAREYLEQVLGKSFVDNNLKIVDEISSAIVGGLSAGTIIAGQVTANMMKLSKYAQNGTEYHEAFHWAFELIMDPREANKVRKLVRKKYGITGDREVAEWLADTYMHYVRRTYTPNATLLQKAFNKIKQWAITFSRIFTGDYQLYKVFYDINSGRFADKPIKNEAVLRFQEKFKELNSKEYTAGYEKDGVSYKYIQGPIDHIKHIKQIAMFSLINATVSPAVNYVKNSSVTINVKDAINSTLVKRAMQLDYYDKSKRKFIKGFTTEELLSLRKNPKAKAFYSKIDNALAIRELLDDQHIEKTHEYAVAMIDRIIGVKGKDLSAHGEDDSSEETKMDPTYADIENGQSASDAGRISEHIIPDHQVSRMSKTSSRIKLFFGTIPIRSKQRQFITDKKTGEKIVYYDFGKDEFGKYGYYDLTEIYQYVQNRYYHALSLEALLNAIEEDSKTNPMIYSLYNQLYRIKRLACTGNNNAIGLLNEIYKSIRSANHSHEVITTRKEQGHPWITYKSVNMMEQDNSFAIKREFTDTVLGGFNDFFREVPYKYKGKEFFGLQVPPRLYDEYGKVHNSSYREEVFLDFFNTTLSNKHVVEEIEDGVRKKVNRNKVVPSIYTVISSYGTKYPKPFYVEVPEAGGYVETSIDDNIPYVKNKLVRALSAVGLDVTVDQIDDILETQFGGTGILQLKQFLTERYTLPRKGNTHEAGAQITLVKAISDLAQNIASALANGGGILRVMPVQYGNEVKDVDGKDVFRGSQAHMILAILLAKAQQKKYEVSARGVDGKLSYAMSDDNTVTAMCDAIFDKTGDIQCAKIRQMITNDPFNISNGTELFGNIPVGSFILPQIGNDDVGFEIINDAGIETGNHENSSTNSDKRGADTIMGIIVKLCQNMIVVPPFADKSTALGIRLYGIKIPGIDYSAVSYDFRENEDQPDTDKEFKNYIRAINVDYNGKVTLGDKNNDLDRTIAQYVLAEYNQAKKAIQDYKDILRNHALSGSKTEVEEKYRTAFNICKKLMFMSQFSGDYTQNEQTGEWIFNAFGVKPGSNKTDVAAAEEMISQFEAIVNDEESLLQFVNRHINGLVQHEIEKLTETGIVKTRPANERVSRPTYSNVLLDNHIIKRIVGLLNSNDRRNSRPVNSTLNADLALRIFMYDIVGKSIISKQESERLFTGQSNLYNIVRDKETKIIAVPYQDQAKRIGSFASTGSVGVIEDEDYTCAEIADDMEPIEEQVRRSVYANAISYYVSTGGLDMSNHPDFDLRSASSEQMMDLIPKGFQPLVKTQADNALKGFVLKNKKGEDNLNNVTDGAAFISANFAKKLLKAQGAWDDKIAKAFDRLCSNKKEDIEQILNDYKTFSDVWTQVIGMYKYTAVGFRTENVNGQDKVVQYVNKYALAPVFACMCNNKMDAIRRQMEEQNVDVLMFESAVKVGAHGNSDFTVDDDGNTTGKFNTYTQKSFFLRKQLNTDPNEKETMKIGIQTVKVALSAIIGQKQLEWKGKLVDGDDIIKEIMQDINNLTDARYEKLISKLRTSKDVLNYVAKFLRGNNVPEEVVAAFLDDVPAEALGIQKHIDTLSVKRIQEDVVRMNAPGSAFIQRCVYGVEGPGVKFGNFEVNDGEELKVVNSDGSMDCVLSIDYFVEYKNGIPYFKLTKKGQKRKKLTVHDPNTGEERPMSFEEIRAWLKSSGIIGKNAKASILSYRIPTQAVASINALKCVDVIPVVRDTVILPKLFTTITGADFDIDKLFISTTWYEMEDQEDGSYIPVQVEDNTTEEGLSNVVINDYIDVLCATAKKFPEVFYMSIDQDTKLADDVIAQIKSLYPPTEKDNRDNSSGILQAMPSMQAKVHDEFLAGKQGIAPFALSLVNHVLTRIYKISFLPNGIYLDHKSLAKDKDDDGKPIMAWLSAMINKHVDVAKNPDITYLNVNDSTFNVVALLLRLGYGRRTFMFTCQDIMRDYAYNINQETAVCKYSKNDNGYVDARAQAYDIVLKKYGLTKTNDSLSKHTKNEIYAAACREIFDKNVDGKPLCEYVLEHHGEVPEGMTIRIGKEDYKLTKQLFNYLNLQLFNYLSDAMAQPLTALQQASVIDNERCITSMIQSSFYEDAVDKVRHDNIFSRIDKLFQNSYIDGKISAVINVTDRIYRNCSSIDKNIVTTVAKAIDPNILSYGTKRMNTFLSIIRDGIVAYYGTQFFDRYCKENNIDRSTLFKTGRNSIAKRLSDIQRSARSNRGNYRSLRNNLLIKGLSIEGIIGEKYLDSGEITYNNHRFMFYEFLRFKYAGQSDDNILADVQEAWRQLLDHPDEKIKNFARDLVVYAFYTSGEMSGMTKLFKYVPPSWRMSSGYGDYFKTVRDNPGLQQDQIDDIVDKLCRNLWYKDKFVKTIGMRTMYRFKGSNILKNHSISIQSEELFSNSDDEGGYSDPIFSPIIAGIQETKNGQMIPIFDGDKSKCPRYIKCVDDHNDQLTGLDDDASSWTLYKLVGFNSVSNKNDRLIYYPVYVQTSVLGEKYYRNNIFEYGDQLEENNNLDAYEVTKAFLQKLGARKQTSTDVDSVKSDLVKLLMQVSMAVDQGLIGREAEIVEETMDVLFTDKQKGISTFQPLRIKDDYIEEQKKREQKRQEKICNKH